MNWRRLELSREVWILLCGFPFDRRSIHEINNAVCKFGKFVMWGRNKSTRANLMVKIKVEELRDIPASIAIGEGDETATLTVPVVILQDTMLGREAPDEDLVPLFGNHHSIPAQANFHQNHHNHFLGPLQHHEQEVLGPHNQNNHLNLQLALNGNVVMEADNEEEDIELPGWGHWAMPAENQMVNQEIHEGEFLNLNDLMEPMEEDQGPQGIVEQIEANNNITASQEPPNNSAETAASANGPLAPNLPVLPDLNVEVGPLEHQVHLEPIMAHVPPAEVGLGDVRINGPPLEDFNLSVILRNPSYEQASFSEDPMQHEVASAVKSPNITSRKQMVTPEETDPINNDTIRLGGTTEIPLMTAPNISYTVERTFESQVIMEQELVLNNIEPVVMFVNPLANAEETDTVANPSNNKLDAPMEELLGKEGAIICDKHFAPKKDNKVIIRIRRTLLPPREILRMHLLLPLQHSIRTGRERERDHWWKLRFMLKTPLRTSSSPKPRRPRSATKQRMGV